MNEPGLNRPSVLVAKTARTDGLQRRITAMEPGQADVKAIPKVSLKSNTVGSAPWANSKLARIR